MEVVFCSMAPLMCCLMGFAIRVPGSQIFISRILIGNIFSSPRHVGRVLLFYYPGHLVDCFSRFFPSVVGRKLGVPPS